MRSAGGATRHRKVESVAHELIREASRLMEYSDTLQSTDELDYPKYLRRLASRMEPSVHALREHEEIRLDRHEMKDAFVELCALEMTSRLQRVDAFAKKRAETVTHQANGQSHHKAMQHSGCRRSSVSICSSQCESSRTAPTHNRNDDNVVMSSALLRCSDMLQLHLSVHHSCAERCSMDAAHAVTVCDCADQFVDRSTITLRPTSGRCVCRSNKPKLALVPRCTI